LSFAISPSARGPLGQGFQLETEAVPQITTRAERHLLVKRARMQGFVIFDYAPRFEEAVGRLALWVRDGRLRYSEDVLEGIEHAPGAIAGLYRGENTGKRLIKIR
jgi:NADPH-dependent curcumin reductase CurA